MKELFETAAEYISRLFPGLQALYLFGSSASGQSRPESDLDLGLLFPPNRSPEASVLQSESLEMGRLLDRDTDLVDLRRTDTVFCKEVIDGGRLLFSTDERARMEFEMLTLSYYQKLNEERADILTSIREKSRILLP